MIGSIRYMAIMGVVLTAILSLLFCGITALIIFAPDVLLKNTYYALLFCCAILACYFFYCFIYNSHNRFRNQYTHPLKIFTHFTNFCFFYKHYLPSLTFTYSLKPLDSSPNPSFLLN